MLSVDAMSSRIKSLLSRGAGSSLVAMHSPSVVGGVETEVSHLGESAFVGLRRPGAPSIPDAFPGCRDLHPAILPPRCGENLM